MTKILAIILFLLPAVLMAQQKPSPVSVEQINKLVDLGLSFAKTDSSKAFNYALKAKALADKARYVSGQAGAQRIMGIAWAQKNRVPAAIAAFNKAIQLYTPGKYGSEVGVLYSDIGIALLSQNNRKEALGYFLKAEQLHRLVRDNRNLLTDLNQIGVVYYQGGSNEKAVTYYIEAAALADKINDQTATPQIYNNLGQLMFSDKNYTEATQYFLKAINLNRAANDQRNLGIATLNLANVYTERSDYKKATIEYHNALKAFTAVNFAKGVQVCYNNLGAIALRQGNYEEAIPILEKSLKISRDSKNFTGVALTQQNIAYAYMKMKQFQKAADLYNDAEQSAITYKNNASVFGEIYNHRSMLDSAIGNYRNAFLSRNKYLMIKDSLLNERLSKQINELQTKYETEKKGQQIDLLNRQNTIQSLNLKNQQLQLFRSSLQISKDKLEIDRNKLYLANQQLQLKQKQGLLDKRQLESQKKDIVIARHAITELKSRAQLSRNQRVLAGLAAATVVLILVVLLVSRNMRLQRIKLVAEKALAASVAQQELLNEKLRISGELHDNIGSQLTFIHSSIQNLRTDPENGWRSDLQETENIAVNAIRDLRQTVWFINNTSFTTDDFVIRLREYVKPYQAINNVAIAINNQVPASVILSSAKATHLFRILQEAINNAVKYAAASEIRIDLTQDRRDSMAVSINDNGQGFDTTLQRNGFGLRNMEDRAKRSGGKLAITSAPDKGTSVYVSVPV